MVSRCLLLYFVAHLLSRVAIPESSFSVPLLSQCIFFFSFILHHWLICRFDHPSFFLPTSVCGCTCFMHITIHCIFCCGRFVRESGDKLVLHCFVFCILCLSPLDSRHVCHVLTMGGEIRIATCVWHS